MLLKATNPQPWNDSAQIYASSISKHLEYLPLALVHAGRSIFHGLCTLQGYIPFFNEALSELGRKKPIQIPDVAGDGEDGVGAFETFEIIYSGLEAQALRKMGHGSLAQDAIELINIFMFLHYADINLANFLRRQAEISDNLHS